MSPEEKQREQKQEYLFISLFLIIGSALLALCAIYFMREHTLTVLTPPLVVAALFYVRLKSPNAAKIRNWSTLTALTAFNASIIFGGGLTLPDSHPEMTPSFAALASLLPTVVTIMFNFLIGYAWWRGRHLATPVEGDEPATHVTARHGE